MKHFETLRQAEFARLDETDHAYLDYAAAALQPESSLTLHMDFLKTQVVSQPGTSSPASTVATDLLSRTRTQVLTFFKAAAEHYCVIFTPGASSASHLVGDRYPFRRGSTLALLADNHCSVVSLRSPARAAGATVVTVPLQLDLRAPDLVPHLKRRSRKADNLLAYPAQSNFSGVHHPLMLIDEAHELGYDVLLDAAAFVPSNTLDLSATRPDFVAISFYKMFGYPTGIGALLVRRKVLRKLKRNSSPSRGGGGYSSTFSGDGSRLMSEEDMNRIGAANFLAMPGILAGLQFLQEIGLEQVGIHIAALTGRLLRGLLSIWMGDGRLAVSVYGPKTTIMRGGIVSFNVMDIDGRWVDARIVQAAASARRVSVRIGCFENVGAADRALDGERIGRKRNGEGMSLCMVRSQRSWADGFFGAVRASVGIASNQADVDRLIEVVQGIVSGSAESRDGASVVKMESAVSGGGSKRNKSGNAMSRLRKGEGRTMSHFGSGG